MTELPIQSKITESELNNLPINTQFAIENAIISSLGIVMNKWRSEAQKRLNSTASSYLAGLTKDSISYPAGSLVTGTITLVGELPNALENGYPAFDMKTGFMRSSRARSKKDGGWYFIVPFRHTTPNRGVSPMPNSVYKSALRLNPYLSGAGNTVLNYSAPTGTSWTGYKHKTNPYQGMVRIVNSGKKMSRSIYKTFRHVSDTSAPNSWQHPGFSGVKITEKLVPYAKNLFTKILENNLRKL